MADNQSEQSSQTDSELEREIRRERKFTLAEAIGRMAGPGAMKGESPVARLEQAAVEIENWLAENLADAEGGLRVAFMRCIRGSEPLLSHFDDPLTVLDSCCRRILDSEYLLEELVRQADIEWGRQLGERPYFQRPGEPAHPRDPYTINSVRSTLLGLLRRLAPNQSHPS